jgi:regulator of sirC expression with transglutaminase-like and TPR domain
MNGPETSPLLELLSGRPSTLELDRAALEVARLGYPALDPAPWIAALDRHAFAIADRCHDLSDGARFIQTANAYLFGELGLRGNQDDYYNADNSCLNRVLELKLGLPITLSVIYIETARRLAKPVSGVGLPGHFAVLYDDGRYSTFIDPFHGGALVDAAGCRQLAQMEVQELDTLDPEMLAPVDTRSIVLRMINNLRRAWFGSRDSEKALRLLDLLIAADPNSADEHKQRAVALMQLQRIAESLAAFERYLELAPGAPDRERIQEQMRSLAFWMASRN